MLKQHILLVILMSILAGWVVESRLHLNTINLLLFKRDGSWTFIDRMHLDPGHMSIRSTIKLAFTNVKQGAAYHLQIVAIPEEIWQKSLEVKCNEQGLSSQQLHNKHVKEMVYDFYLDESNSYSTGVSSKLEVPLEETYHFVLRDCGKTLVNDGYGREAKINISLDMRNNDSHISSGEHLYGWLLPVLILTGGIMLWFLHRQKEEQGDNWIKLLVKISLWIGVSSIIMKYIGYLVYHGSGVQHGFYDFFYLLLHSSSDSIMLVLIILLSFGWTVTFNSTRDFDLYVPLACMLGLLNIIMTMLNKISDGEHDKYHMFDSIPAYIMLTFRSIGMITFLFGIGKSWVQFKNSKDPEKTKQYLYHLTAIGFFYMAFVPIGFIAIRLVSNRYKKEVMFFSMELARSLLTIWLALLAGWKKSIYRTIIDGSFMEKAEKFY